MSIWTVVDRSRFEKDVRELYTVARYQRVVSVTTASFTPPISFSNDDTLPAAVEKQLANDFAFLAAWQPNPSCVAAATINRSSNLTGTVISISANGSQRFIPYEGWQTLGVVPLGPRVRRLSQQASTLIPTTAAEHAESILLKQQLSGLASAIETIDASSEAPSTTDLIAVVHAAYEATRDGVSLIQRLQSLGYPIELANRKEVRQVQAIGKYWRICKDLATTARAYRQHFMCLELAVIEPTPMEIWPLDSENKHFVHAEIQLLVQHERSILGSAPRYIGTSKRPCFLCHCFLRAHGKYNSSDSHGEVHPQWTVPDDPDFTTQVRDIISDTLQKMALEVRSALEASRECSALVAPPMQNVINLSRQQIRTPSASTLASNGMPGKIELERTDSVTAVPQAAQLSIADASVSVVRRRIDADRVCLITDLIPATPWHKSSIGFSDHAYVRLNGVEMFVDLDQGGGLSKFNGASCTVHPEGLSDVEQDVIPSVDLSSMAAGEEMTLTTQIDQARLAFELKSGFYEHVIELKWHRKDAASL
ncbi:hypothetical protein LTR56_011873 [Elasticomyces elasticus]|nr:hypothetical protein LTR56_011873 [Elasticomyces elasticus]KAK5767851.1 hypothetical protein LTS12_002003 [Elasticomyces elasticus]